MSQRPKRSGQSMVEVIIAISVVGVVMVSVVAAVSLSVRNAARSRAKAIGTKYTQEGLEYFRAQKNLMGWESFAQTVSQSGTAQVFCLASLLYSQNGGLEQLPNRNCTTYEFVDPNKLYRRKAVVSVGSASGQEKVSVTVTTIWPDGSRTAVSTATVDFQPFQQ